MKARLIHGDSAAILKTLAENSVDAVVTDPPYGLSFMGRKWDYDVPGVELWREVLRVLKPGGHLLAFAGTRTQHRMAVNIEDAGFEIRDMIAWVYGEGFPKNHNVSKAIDKMLGATREVVGKHPAPRGALNGTQSMGGGWTASPSITAPGSPEAKTWDGWGTALKPALEPITLARKPIPGTIAECVLEHGTGAINIDGCRVKTSDNSTHRKNAAPSHFEGTDKTPGEIYFTGSLNGRWPANFIHDGSPEVVELFPVTGKSSGGGTKDLSRSSFFMGDVSQNITSSSGLGDSGSAARYFYCAKASKRERNEGLEGHGARNVNDGRKTSIDNPYQRGDTQRRNIHPTVKPIQLMRYLCRLITPPGGVVLDPFMGSGTTGIAATLEGFSFAGIERDAEYVKIATARVEHWSKKKKDEDQEKDTQALPGQIDLFEGVA